MNSYIRETFSYDDIALVPANSELNHTSDADISVVLDKLPLPFKASLPIIPSPMDMVGGKEMLVYLLSRQIPITIHRYFQKEEDQISFFSDVIATAWKTYGEEILKLNGKNIFVSIGSVSKWKDSIDMLLDYRHTSGMKFGICLDMAAGSCSSALNTVEYCRKKFKDMNIMAGNVATKSGYSLLESAGANLIRVGVSGGSICATEVRCGFGVPTATSVADCAERKSENSYLLADGGISSTGSIVKSIRLGSDLVFLGRMLAATNLSPGAKYDRNCELTANEEDYVYCEYRGMASKEARDASPCRKSGSIEGVSGLIRYTGTTEQIINEIEENLKNALSYYGGVRTWHELRKFVKIIRRSTAGYQESLTRVIER